MRRAASKDLERAFALLALSQGLQRRMVLVVNFFVILKIFFCFVIALSDLVYDVEDLHDLR